MLIASILLLATSFGFSAVTASPTDAPAGFAGAADVISSPLPNSTIGRRQSSGCGSVGPLGTGHYIWYITSTCTSGTEMYVVAGFLTTLLTHAYLLLFFERFPQAVPGNRLDRLHSRLYWKDWIGGSRRTFHFLARPVPKPQLYPRSILFISSFFLVLCL